MWCVVACTDGVCVVPVDPLIPADRPFDLYLYICIENRWTFTGIFGVATAHLRPLSVLIAPG